MSAVMGYCISRQETLAKAVRRILREQLNKALAGLSDTSEPVEGVHATRKTLKRIRAVLRLIRFAVPVEFFRRMNLQFRDAGRSLSPLRDVHVQREALEQLGIPASTMALTFGDKLADEEKTISSDRELRQKARALIASGRAELPRWPLEKVDDTQLSRGLRRIYKSVRRSYQTAAADPSPANLHEWRKRTKDFWYAFELLGELRSRSMTKHCRRTKKLSDYLGADHDFFFIGENLRQQQLARPRSELHQVGRVIARKRDKLQRCALRLGAKIFTEKPKTFEKRMARRLKKQGRGPG